MNTYRGPRVLVHLGGNISIKFYKYMQTAHNVIYNLYLVRLKLKRTCNVVPSIKTIVAVHLRVHDI